ncbi:MAG: outer membrane protein assembly factor BamB [Oxalobacteraceae bacterium]|nr:outer membrane protein assembly factor BamB [Oxalobacteraceae bacterium]
MHSAVKLAGAMILVTLAGCASLNPFSKPPQRNPPVALVEFKPTMAVRTAWTVAVGKSNGFDLSPAVAGSSVFAAGADGTIARFDVATGAAIWRINAGASLTAGVGSDGNTVAVSGAKGMIFAFDGDGKLRWKAQTSSEVLSAPAVTADLVIVRSVDNRIAAFDVATGTRRWFLQRTTPALTLRSAPGIVTNDTAAYAAMPGGRLLAMTLNNGAPLWEVAVGDPRGATELERVSDTSGNPVIIGREICAVAYQGRVACFDLAGGAVRWSKDWSSDVGVGADERFIFAANDTGAVSAFARDTGTNVWRNDKLGYRRLSAPVSFGRSVAIGDGQGYIHFLARDDGAFLARVATDGSPIVATPVVAGDRVIFQTQAGALVALAAE